MNKHIFLLIFWISLSCQAQEDIRQMLLSCNQSVEAGEYDTAIEFAQQALKYDRDNQEAWLCKGRAYGRAGQAQPAIESLQTAVQKAGTPQEHIMALTLLGNIYKNFKEHTKAIESYKKSLEVSQQNGNRRFEHINHNLMGDTLLESNEPLAALDNYLAGSQKAANDNERADSFERIAATYLSLKQYDQAIEYQVKAQIMQQKSGTLDQYANASLELGHILTEAKDYRRAEKTLSKIIQFSKDNGGAYYEAKGYYYLAKVKAAADDHAAAKVMLAEAKRIAGQIGDEVLGHDIAKAMELLD